MTFLPYIHLLRLHKTKPILLLYIPCAWGFVWSAYLAYTKQYTNLWAQPSFYITWGVFALAALATRSAGCIINDMWDRSFDKHVSRTAYRPLASGRVSMGEAAGLLVMCVCVSLLTWIYLSWFAKITAIVVACFIALYPSAKRFFPCPQLVLGITYNGGFLITCAHLFPHTFQHASTWLLYASSVLWTVYYDTLYAVSDMEDDTQLGLHSAARLFMPRIKKWLACILGVAFVSLGIVAARINASSVAYGLLAAVYVWQICILCCVHHPALYKNCSPISTWSTHSKYQKLLTAIEKFLRVTPQEAFDQSWRMGAAITLWLAYTCHTSGPLVHA